jgi:hypothetical protein
MRLIWVREVVPNVWLEQRLGLLAVILWGIWKLILFILSGFWWLIKAIWQGIVLLWFWISTLRI